LNGPFNVLLRSPEMGDQAQKLGAQLRFHSSLPDKLRELAIIMTARSWNAQYEWYAHKRLALQVGLSPALIDAIAAGKRPASMEPDVEAAYDFASELLKTRQVSDRTFHAAVAKLGERGVVDLTALMGYYHMVSMLLNIDRYPLPDGVQPELKPLP
jgi:4-carboxymuconolactone decarboxylase